jgi:regulator of protease activity HflC (stomatin/prohibitin superfamily)
MKDKIENYEPTKEREVYVSIEIILVLVLLAGFILITALNSFYTVQAGERAILLTWGNPNEVPYTSGLHLKIPFVQTVVKMDVKTLKYEAAASAASQDLQTVSTNVAVNYHLSADSIVTLYREIGVDYQDKIIQPAVQEVVKSITAKYTAEQLITKRAEVKEAIDVALKERMRTNNIIVETLSITNFDFSSSFNAAIENKVTTEQNALAAKNKLAQVEYEAQQRIAQAEGEAKAIKIQAEAIQSQGGKEYVQLQAISKWDGKLPTYTGGGAMPFIDITTTKTV